MSSESVVVPLLLLMKDEKKYADVDVLDQLEAWVYDIYLKAGVCVPEDQAHVPPAPPIVAPSQPDQPSSMSHLLILMVL